MHYIKAKTILSKDNGLNIYRGCTHGCIYCDSRSKCYHIDHEFTDIAVKENAIELLDIALSKKKSKIMIGSGSMSDPYMHLESKLLMTRKMLEVINKHRNGVDILTKSTMVLRDLDLLKEINSHSKVVIGMTLTTFHEHLCKILEPNAPSTKKRVEALKILDDNGINVGVWLSPILPFINDTEENLMGILNMCKEAHVKYIMCFGFGVTLREGDREYFYAALDKYFPQMKERYIKKYGLSYELSSPNSHKLYKTFVSFCEENKIIYKIDECFNYLKTYESHE